MTKRKQNSRLKPIGREQKRLPAFMLAMIGAALGLSLFAWGVAFGFNRLRAICNEQCRVLDLDLDVVVTTPGKMVTPDAIHQGFGLTNGANLAEVDFAGKRASLLARIPNIRDLRIERRMPNRVTIDVIEREPVARVTGIGKNTPFGLMADSEGVIFRFARATAAFPIIRVGGDVKLKAGERLTGRAAAALRLVETAALPDFLKLNVQEVGAIHPDYLTVTLGNYSRAKVAWERMDEDSPSARASLKRQLKRLTQALATNLASPTATWIVTDYGTPGRVYASQNDR